MRDDSLLRCSQCTYPLRGLTNSRCPECGSDCAGMVFVSAAECRRKHLTRVVCIATAICLSILAILVALARQTSYHRTIEVCSACGLSRSIERVKWRTENVWTGESQEHDTLASLLVPIERHHRHQWQSVLEQTLDWRKQEQLPRLVRNNILVLLIGEYDIVTTRDLAESVRGIGAMCKDDVLSTRLDANSRRRNACLLVDMYYHQDDSLR